MNKLTILIDTVNASLLNPAGLHLLHPAKTGFLFLEIEYY